MNAAVAFLRRRAAFGWARIANRIDPCGPFGPLNDMHYGWPSDWFGLTIEQMVDVWANEPAEEQGDDDREW